MNNTSRRSRMKAVNAIYAKSACVLCGRDIRDSGRIFHGQCVCTSCIGHISNMPSEKIIEAAVAAESQSVYAG